MVTFYKYMAISGCLILAALIAHAGKSTFKATNVEVLPLEEVRNIINQIDAPEKVVIPQFVAEWIEYCKKKQLNFDGAFEPVSEHGIGLAETFKGNVLNCTFWASHNQELFARAWLDGYEVEQEQLYTVEIPYNRRMFRAVLCSTSNKIVMVEIKKELEHKNNACYRLTEAEIKKDFKWAWDAGFAALPQVQEVE